MKGKNTQMKRVKKSKEKNKSANIKTFSVPFQFPLGENQENITITTAKYHKEQLLDRAFSNDSKGNIEEAAKYYEYCINQGIKDSRVFSNYGVILQNLGKSKEAELFTRKAIELNPVFVDAHSNLGSILKDIGNLEEAESSTRKAIELNPNFAMAHCNLGSILKDIGNLEEAESSTRKAIELNPNFAMAHSNLGIVLRNLGNLREAELSIRRAIEINPNFAEAFCNLSLIELLQGDYKNGLENYEYRFKQTPSAVVHGETMLKRLDKQKLAKEEKLLVVTEQGLGDTMQYMRYVPYLRSQGIDVSFSAQKKLHSLIKASGIDQNPLAPEQVNQVKEGKWIPLLSLPRHLKIRPNNPIISEPYIYSTDELNQKWKNILSTEKRPIIGINWQGNPSAEKNNLKGRSLPLETFSNILVNDNFKLLSLQKGFGSEQLNHCSFKNRFVNCQEKVNSCWDFLENAAIIHNCDLIITSDTSIAHLAGGMGKSTWLLLQHVPEWRWGLESDNTFWYPKIKLFRQKEQHNWQEVMERVSCEIKKEFKDKV